MTSPQSAPGEAQALPLVKIEHIYGRKVWIESDMMGARHVMVQHDAPDTEPFCYCSFHYDYAYTSNAGTLSDATRMAVALGATEPVEERHRELEFELEFDRDVIDSAMKAAARIAELEAEVRRLRPNAERYEWLRRRIPGGTYRIMGVIYSEGGAGVDAAIDAARKETPNAN